MWWYTLAVLVIWVTNSELRRLYDWKFGFSQVEVLAMLPLLCLIPHIYSLTIGGGWKRLPRLPLIAAWIWVGGFTYALVIAFLSGNALPGSYAFITFVFPIAIGLWIAADGTAFPVAYGRVTRLLFALTTIISVYGIIQYVAPPIWDLVWLQNIVDSGTTTFGHPAPFQVRVFSMLNSPGTFAVFMAMMTVLVLPELSLRKPLLLLQMPLWFIAFGLSLVRTGWIMFAIGVAVYLIFAPRRGALLASFGLTAALVAGLVAILPAATGNDQVVTSLNARFATLTDLEEDESGRERQDLYGQGLLYIASAPLGQGLGVIGVSTKLGDAGSSTSFDSGFLGRLLEMGIPGAAMYFLPLIVLVGASFKLWYDANTFGNTSLQVIAATTMGVEASFAFEQVACDASALMLLTLWLLVCMVMTARTELPSGNDVFHERLHMAAA
jgi:putative inorganic carbon (HCO3(-)) transporter